MGFKINKININSIYFNQKVIEICNESNAEKLKFKFNKKLNNKFQQGLMKSLYEICYQH